MSKTFRKVNIPALAVTGLALVAGVVFASNQAQFTLKINAGTLAIDIADTANDFATVASPTVAIGGGSGIPASMTALVGAAAPAGTLGTADQAVFISNPDATAAGWTASLAATAPAATAEWDSGTAQFAYNAATAPAGQLTVDPSVATLTNGRSLVGTTGVSLSSSQTFVLGTTDVVTLVDAAAYVDETTGAAKIGDWVIQGIALNQTIPAQTSSGDYTLPMTLSVLSK